MSVAFEDANLAAQSVRFQVAVVTSCIAIEPGERPIAPLQIVEFSVDETARALGALDPGEYGLYARAIDENCDVVAAGCQPITVEAGGEGNLRVVLSAAGGDLCGASSACVNGRCESGVDGGVRDSGAPDVGLTCLDGQLMCDGMCVPSDSANCGMCGNTCDFPSGSAVCAEDMCVLTGCNDGFEDCDAIVDNGCEASLQSPMHCGGCSMTCGDTAPLCSSVTDESICVADCGVTTQCGSSCVDTESNPVHCGGCDRGCDALNAVSACEASECLIATCDMGHADCDGDATNGCEVEIGTDEQNCGACDVSCEVGQQCREGACTGYIGVDVGPSHACGIQVDSSLWCWGRNDAGQTSLEAGGSLETPTQFLVRPATPWLVQNVAIGARHTCAINAANVLECAGDNSLGQRGNRVTSTGPVNVSSLVGTFSRQEFQQIAAGANHTCAIDAVNGAWCWGDNQYRQRGLEGTTPTGATTIDFVGRFAVSLAISDDTSCFLLDDGRVQCVGKNDLGQAGRRSASPFEATGSVARTNDGGVLTNVRSLVAGAETFCAILTTDQLMCWGSNTDSEIDATIEGPVIGAIEVTSSASEVYLFDGTICWRTPVGDGELSCRGRRRDAQFAGAVNAAATDRDTRLPMLDDIRDVVAGHSAACGFREGVLVCWGASYEGVIPRESLNVETPSALLEMSATPVRRWTNITLSSNGGCGVDNFDRPRCWGDGQYGALGDGTQMTAVEPVSVTGGGIRRPFRGEFGTGQLQDSESLWWTGTESVMGLFGGTRLIAAQSALVQPAGFSAVFRHGCAVSDRDGSVVCWGESDFGKTGRVNESTTVQPVRIEPFNIGVYSANVVLTGEDFTCALKEGLVECWGSNRHGQLDTRLSSSQYPVTIDLPTRMERLAVGRRHACASSPASGVYCWGANESGQVGDGDMDTSAEPVRVPGIESPTAISAGANFSCAVDDGSVFCWGANERYQLGNGTNVPRLAPSLVDVEDVMGVVSAPMGHGSCANDGEGQWFCWGANDSGGLSVGAAGIFNAPTSIPF